MNVKTFLVMAIVAICAMACSDSDSASNVPAIDWTGTYGGYSVAQSKHFKHLYTNGESLQLVAQQDGTVALRFPSTKWGVFEVPHATVTRQGDTYHFAGNGRVAMGMGEQKTEYDFTLNGTCHATKQPYSFSFHLPAVMGGLTLTLLPGEAPAQPQPEPGKPARP